MESALDHVLQASGKRIRPQLVHRFGSMVGGDPDRLMSLGLAVELLHTATLVHDDVIDAAHMRRGRPALHRVSGPEVALLVGDLYLARCGVHLAEVDDRRATGELFGALATIVRGELQQRGHRFDLEQGEADYFRTIQRKTASLVEAACASAVVVSGGSDVQVDAGRTYGRHVGIAFQVVDDILDYTGDAAELGKPVGNDIREGTVTLPLILALESSTAPLREMVAAARERADFSAVLAAVRRGGVIERCQAVAEDHAARGVAALDAFPASAERDSLAELSLGLSKRRN
jgi:octaprenyl-diphosphate synthase